MPPGFSGMELFRMIASMVLVLALLAALLYVHKRMQAKVGAQASGRRMKLMESLSLNSRHKIALLQVDGHTVVVGMSPAQMTCLAHWTPDGQAVSTPNDSSLSAWSSAGGRHVQ